MIRMEYPKANLDGLSDIGKIYALKRQVDILTDNLQIVLDSIESDLQSSITATSDGSIAPTPTPTITETDPTVPSWAKASTKPTYTASEVGALPNTTVIPSKTSDLQNDSGFLTSFTETDPSVPNVTASDNGKVMRVVNGAWSAVQLPSASGVSF